MIPTPELPVRRIAWGVVIVVILAVISSGIIYFVSHGRIVINTSQAGLSSLIYCLSPCSNGNMVETTSSTVTVPSGEYVVQINLQNNTSYTKNIHVGRFLGTTTVDTASYSFSLSTLAATTNQHILPLDGSFITYDPEGSAYVLGQSNILLPSQLTAAHYVSAHELLLIEHTEGQESVSQAERVLLYDTSSKTTTSLGTISGIDAATVHYGHTALYGILNNAKGYTLVRIAPQGITESSIPENISVAKNNDVPIMSASDIYTTVLSGNDYYIPQADEQSSSNLSSSIVTIYQPSFKKVREIQLGARNDISKLSLSPTSKYLAVIGENSIQTYDTETGTLQFETRAHNPSGSSILWRNDSSFIYQIDTGGIYLSDIREKESYSILNTSLLRITDISAVVDNKVYFTAYPNEEGNYDRVNPAGYVIDISTTSPSTATTADDSLLRKLPYDGLTYSITYHFDKDSHLILDVSAESGSRNSAIEKIAELGFDPGDYTIQFRGYTNPFGNEGETP